MAKAKTQVKTTLEKKVKKEFDKCRRWVIMLK